MIHGHHHIDTGIEGDQQALQIRPVEAAVQVAVQRNQKTRNDLLHQINCIGINHPHRISIEFVQ